MKVGVGFLFGAKDDGLVKSLKQVETGFSGIEVKTDGATKSGQRFSTMLQGLNLLMLRRVEQAIDGVGSKLDQVGESRGPAGQMESTISQAFRSFDKDFRAGAVSAGVFGDELRAMESKAFSLGRSLNRPEEAMGSMLLTFKKMNLSPEDVLGAGSDWSDLAKSIEATGLSADQIAEAAANLKYSYDFGDRTNEFFDQQTQIATSLGLGQSAFSGMMGELEQFDSVLARTTENEGPDAILDLQRSLGLLAGSFKDVAGLSPEQAMSEAVKLFGQLGEEAQAQPEMFAALGTEFGSMANELGMVDPQGFQGVLDDINSGMKDPAAFAVKMSELRSEITKAGDVELGTRFDALFSKASPSLAFLLQQGEDFTSTIGALADKIDTAGIPSMKALGKEAFRSGRGFDDRLQLARENLQDTFMAIGKEDVGRYVSAQEKAYAKLGDRLEEAGQGAGFLASTLKRLSAYSAGGIGAAIFGANMTEGNAMLVEVFNVLQDGVSTVAPFVGLLASVGVSVVTLGGAAITAGGAITGFFGTMVGLGWAIIPIAAGVAAQFALLAAGATAVAGGAYLVVKAFQGELGPTLERFGEIATNALTSMKDWGAGFLSSITSYMDGIDPKAITDSFVSLISTAVGDSSDFMAGGSGEVSAALNETMTSLWVGLGNAATATYGAAKRFAIHVYGLVAQSLSDGSAKKVVADAGNQLLSMLWAGLTKVPGLVMMAQDAASNVIGGLFGAALSVLNMLDYSAIYGGMVDGIANALGRAGEMRAMLTDRFRSAIEGVDWGGVFGRIFENGISARDKILGMVQSFYDTLAEKISAVDWGSLGSTIGKSITEFFVGGVDDTGVAQEALGKVILDFFIAAIKPLGTKDFWVPVGKTLWSGLKLMWAARGAVFDFFVGMFEGIGEALLDAVFGGGNGSKIIEWAKWIGEKMILLQRTMAVVAGGIVIALSPVGSLLAGITVAAGALWSGFQIGQRVVGPAIGAIAGGLQRVYSWLTGEGGVGGGSGLVSAFSTAWRALNGGIDTAVESLSGLWSWLLESSDSTMSVLASIFGDGFGGIGDSVKLVWAGVMDFFSSVWENVTSGITDVSSIITSLADAMGITTTPQTARAQIAGPEVVSEARTASSEKLLSQADTRALMVHLSNEFGRQNEILSSINQSIRGIGSAGATSGSSITLQPRSQQGL